MNQSSLLPPIRYGLNDESNAIFSRHYFEQVLPESKEYKLFQADETISAIESIIEHESFRNEADVEDRIIRPIFSALGLSYAVQTGLGGKSVDYAVYDGESFAHDYTNTTLVVEAEPHGKLTHRYFIKKQDNTDPIAQIRNYLRQVNELLANTSESHSVDFGLLTDGAKWRIYSRKFTHSDRDFEQNFLEFDLAHIKSLPDDEQRNYLKQFCYLLSSQGIASRLAQTVSESQNHELAVTTELRKQVYPALEYIATGLWRRIARDEDPGLHAILDTRYEISEHDLHDINRRADLLKIVYDESLVLLLRLLFILYIEDRKVTDISLIKKPGGILDQIRAYEQPIGQLTDAHASVLQNFDVEFSRVCRDIDQRYNGGIFSDKQHPLLAGFNIDDTLFANAVDNLCRVKLKSSLVTVDFSSISIRELGTLYEGLLEYKFAVADEDTSELVTIADKKKKRLDVRRGDLYLLNQNGERKSTGSYYTPDDMVEYLVARTVGRKVDELFAATNDPHAQLESLYTITVCDPAMGSGHFVVEAFDELVARAERLIEEHELSVNIEDVRARIARNCLYGADLNPIAVDIAKMVMWIRIFRADKPLEFFDTNFVCGDSLIGNYDEAPVVQSRQSGLFLNPEEYEPEMLKVLATRIETLQRMPRATMEDIKAIEAYYQTEILVYQKNVTFLSHLRLTKYLLPDDAGFVASFYEEIALKLLHDDTYIAKLYRDKARLNQKQSRILDIVERIEREFRPLHWKSRFPHIFLGGGFDVILGNPPWDIVKPNHNTFFSSYIDGYDRLETKVAKAKSHALTEREPRIRRAYEDYLRAIEVRNKFFQDAYEHQLVRDSRGYILKGDPNLYKVFIEKAYTILKSGGSCGFVVPSGLNTDQGTTGLRRLLFGEATVRELIMFENRRGLFPAVDSRYKFDCLVYDKTRSRTPKFDAGFYWLDPRWLFGEPEGLDAQTLASERMLHERYSYPLHLSEVYSPEMHALVEARNSADIPILEQIARQPLLGDATQPWYATTYREFDMTNDANLFNTEGVGYPLMEGKTIHHFDAEFAAPTRYVNSEQGEVRLAKKWKVTPETLPSRGYRIAWRDIARSNDTRTVIATILPPYVFTGNTLNMMKPVGIDSTPSHLAGLASLLSSFVLDYVIRFRISTHINMFYMKELPLLRDEGFLTEIGERALPLFAGRDFRDFRGEVGDITDPQARLELRAELDARVARAYGITYEQFQYILTRFPLVSEDIKTETLRAYRTL